MDTEKKDQFTVMVSRGKIVQSIIILMLVTCGAAVLLLLEKTKPEILVVPIFVMVSSFACLAILWQRRRPLCVINDEGITDYGVFMNGYGLIRWRNIDGVNATRDRAGTHLVLKVNNFDELLKRRNPLIRPMFWASGSLGGALGGQVVLPTQFSDADAQMVYQQICRYDDEKFPPSVKPKSLMHARLAISIIAALLAILIVVAAGSLRRGQLLNNPSHSSTTVRSPRYVN